VRLLELEKNPSPTNVIHREEADTPASELLPPPPGPTDASTPLTRRLPCPSSSSLQRPPISFLHTTACLAICNSANSITLQFPPHNSLPGHLQQR